MYGQKYGEVWKLNEFKPRFVNYELLCKVNFNWWHSHGACFTKLKTSPTLGHVYIYYNFNGIPQNFTFWHQIR